MRGLIVGAYAAFPPRDADGAGATRILEAMAAHPAVGGLEVPFVDGLERHPAWRSDWSIVVTGVPGTVPRNERDPGFGLASPDHAGREAALAFARELHAAVSRLRDEGVTVEAVEFHSAPSGRGEPDALRRSLEVIGRLDWGDTLLLLEHCDASTSDHVGEKAYLPLGEEILVVEEAAAADPRWGIGLNWGRSAIEGRGPDLPLEHVRQAAASGLLRSLIFSSASGERTPFGPPWIDRHLPPRDCAFAPPGSLLGSEEMARAAEAAGDLPVLGAKFGFRPDSLSARERAAQLVEAIDVVASAMA